MNRILIVILCVLFIVPSANSQRIRKWMEAADTAFIAKKDYKSAIRLYRTVLTYDSNLVHAKYNIAESARLYKAYPLAKEYYHHVLRYPDSLVNYPLTEFYLAEVYHQTASHEEEVQKFDYENAVKYYEDFLKRMNSFDSGDLNKFKEKAENQLAFIKSFSGSGRRNFLFKDTIIQLSDERNINGPRSDFGLAIWKDSIYFTSMRRQYEKDKIKPNRRFAEVYKVSIDGNETAQPIKGLKQNERAHIANLVFDTDQSRVYYCECEYVKTFDTRCDLYFREVVNGKWGSAQPFKYNDKKQKYTITQPSIGYDRATKEELLFFASDMESKTPGVKDIFFSKVLKNGSFSTPEFIGAINTEDGDEMTPYFDTLYQMLYYSTDGEASLGGADIFSIRKVGDIWESKENLGPTINSSNNDAFFRIDYESESAYFASDRPDSQQYDEELDACCYDIYQIPLAPPVIELETFDALSGEPISKTEISLSEVNGIDTSFFKDYRNEDASLIQIPEWEISQKYKVIAEKEGYRYGKLIEKLDPSKALAPNYFKVKVELDPLVRLRVHTFDKFTNEPLETEMVFVDVTSDNNQEIIRPIKDPFAGSANNTRFYIIDSLRNYHISASKEEYFPAKDTLRYTMANKPYNEDPPILFEDTLYLENFPNLPVEIPFYFDNARPYKDKTKRINVAKPYQDWETLLGKYRSESRKQKYIQGKSLADAAQIKDFYERELMFNYESIKDTIRTLALLLENGVAYNLVLEGLCSPLGNPVANELLAERRIQCIKDYILNYDYGNGSTLKKYLNSNLLNIIEIPTGEPTDLPPDIKEQLESREQGIFGSLPMVQRRVRVLLKRKEE